MFIVFLYYGITMELGEGEGKTKYIKAITSMTTVS